MNYFRRCLRNILLFLFTWRSTIWWWFTRAVLGLFLTWNHFLANWWKGSRQILAGRAGWCCQITMGWTGWRWRFLLLGFLKRWLVLSKSNPKHGVTIYIVYYLSNSSSQYTWTIRILDVFKTHWFLAIVLLYECIFMWTDLWRIFITWRSTVWWGFTGAVLNSFLTGTVWFLTRWRSCLTGWRGGCFLLSWLL